MSKTTSTIAIIAFAAAAFAAAPASAEKMMMKVKMDGAQEVPANTTKGTGEADVTYDSSDKKLTWKLTYSGLTGPATAAHFHGPAAPGANAGVVVPITDTASGTEGSATLTDAQAADLMAGKMYVNVHTAENKGGEIRGQVTK